MTLSKDSVLTHHVVSNNGEVEYWRTNYGSDDV